MRIAIAFDVLEANILNTNLTEDDHPAWNIATAYLEGSRVVYSHWIYEAIADHTGQNPEGAEASTHWLIVGATNKWRPFDKYITDQAINIAGDTIDYSFGGFSAPASSVVCFGLSGETASLTVTDPADGEVYSKTVSLVDTSLIVDAYSYAFEPSRVRSEAVFNGIPPYLAAQIDLTVTDTAENPKVGQIVVGRDYDVGITQYGSGISIEDYSTKERDDWGNAHVVKRPFAKLVDYDFVLPTQRARRAAILLETIRATPAVFFAGSDTDHYGTTVYGYYKSWDITLSGPNISNATMEVEGLT